MNIRKLAKILIFISILVLIITISINVFAITPSSFTPAEDVTAFNSLGKKIVGVIRALGYAVSVGALVALGIKYMLGSIEERAEYKKSMIPYLIGAVLVFATATILGYIQEFAEF